MFFLYGVLSFLRFCLCVLLDWPFGLFGKSANPWHQTGTQVIQVHTTTPGHAAKYFVQGWRCWLQSQFMLSAWAATSETGALQYIGCMQATSKWGISLTWWWSCWGQFHGTIAKVQVLFRLLSCSGSCCAAWPTDWLTALTLMFWLTVDCLTVDCLVFLAAIDWLLQVSVIRGFTPSTSRSSWWKTSRRSCAKLAWL